MHIFLEDTLGSLGMCVCVFFVQGAFTENVSETKKKASEREMEKRAFLAAVSESC